ncbi:MAG: rRNA methyltransferase [Chloroflexi bacterium]|nr:rRNA methyltransferase [Chloroflexota bacterium]
MTDHALIDRFRQARRDTSLAVMDGLHAVKHGLRFGAETLELVSPNVDAALNLAAEVAPDIRPRLAAELAQVSEDDFRQLSPVPPDTGVIAIARRPPVSAADVLCGPADAPVVLLENPRNPFNIGAAVRVAAAAGAGGLLVTGMQDPWHPAAIVSAAGLQFALPVARVDGIPDLPRPVIAIDPQGEPMPWGGVPPGAILAFGTERHGASPELLSRAVRRLSIPMTPRVSSLNLATSVAVALYALKV